MPHMALNRGSGPRQRKSESPPADAVEFMVEKSINAYERHMVLAWHELPNWQQDNEYIYSGYRTASGSFWESLKSLKYVHNETVNIYSHLVGAFLFATLPIYLYRTVYPHYATATSSDILVFSIFFSGVSICFLLSATFHLSANHSPNIAKILIQLDYLGVVVLMWGSTISTVYYGFYCNAELQILYWAMISTLAITCSIATLNPRFNHPTIRIYRTAMYACLGLSSVIFTTHGILNFGWEIQSQRMSLSWMALTAGFNLIGAVVYVMRVPERWYPRRFDVWGSSHQVLHIMVILAGLAHVGGLLKAFDYLHSQIAPCG